MPLMLPLTFRALKCGKAQEFLSRERDHCTFVYLQTADACGIFYAMGVVRSEFHIGVEARSAPGTLVVTDLSSTRSV
jgi:hypothetical protein